MTELEAALDSAPDLERSLDLLESFDCKYPGTHSLLADNFRAIPSSTVPSVASNVRQRHATFRGDEPWVFMRNQGALIVPTSLRCSYVVLGRYEAGSLHAFLDPTVTLHELGHSLHYGIWKANGVPATRSATVSEALADTFAVLVLDDPCVGQEVDPSGNRTGCWRTAAGFDQPLEETLTTEGRGRHDTGQALRDFFSAARKESDLPARLKVGVVRAGQALRSSPVSSAIIADDDGDDIRNAAVAYRLEWTTAHALLDGACAGSNYQACRSLALRLGSDRQAQVDEWIRNAPSTIGQSPGLLADGRRIRFPRSAGDSSKLEVTSADGVAKLYVAPTPEGNRTGRYFSLTTLKGLRFASADGLETIVWTTDGRLAQ